jgi:CDP-glycerol glycerophosphotransferase
VVPVYNDEPYLADCLDSILGQEFSALEIVIVDDGSTDRSAQIAQRYARKHRNVALVQTPNRGLGAARNTGVRHVTGELLAFVDSDDTIPSHAHSLLVSTLDASGSDFVVGSVLRRTDTDTTELSWLKPLHAQRKLSITAAEFPPIVRNIFAWNKVFRRTFWDSAGLAFPEGVMYEDQVAITEAYLRAGSFDIVRRPVYHWWQRKGAGSITQRRGELRALEERLATKQMTAALVRRLGTPAVQDYWLRHALVGDLPLFWRHLPTSDERYWQTLHTGLASLLDGAPPIEESGLRVAQRLVGWLILHGRRAHAEAVLVAAARHPGGFPRQVRDGHVVATLPYLDQPDSGIPSHLYRLREDELAS